VKKLLLAGVVLAAAVAAVAFCGGGPPPAGEAALDTSVYVDPVRDAQPVETVVKPLAGVSAPRPNIVVILADDLGYGDVGAFGARGIRTPNLDQLAREGVRFTQFYASGVYCSPSRAGLLTGRYPLRTGVNFPIQPGGDTLEHRLTRLFGRVAARIGATDLAQAGESAVAGLPASEITLPEALKRAGYATGMVGKWHLGDFDQDPRHHPRRHGFDFFAGFPASNDEFPYSYWRDEQRIDPDLGLAQENVTAELVREAIGFIDRHRDGPFFLYFAHKNVHTPLFPAPGFAGRSAAGSYGDSVEELDASVGELLDALATRGLRQNTLVVFSSDNGPWHQGSAGGLRGRKGQPLEGGQRVPTLVAWPGTVPAGQTLEAPAMNFDLFPTLLALAGLAPPLDRVIDGRDLWPLLSGAQTQSPHEGLFFFNANVIDGVRAGRWKFYRFVNEYVWPTPLDKPNTMTGQFAANYRYTDPKTGRTAALLTSFPLLYDVATDVDESYNVVERHPEEARRLLGLIERWESDFRTNPRGWR
jgi:arylsulfatase A-like enzyme